MGNIMTAVGRRALVKARRFNIENRTEKFLEQKVKVVPPKPMATQIEIAKIHQENPDLMRQLNEVNPELLGRLKEVYVSSSVKPTEEAKGWKNSDRPLPLNRHSEEQVLGYVEPAAVSPGRLSLLQALTLLTKYQADKKANNVTNLALEFNLKKEDVENIVQNFAIFTYVDIKSKTSAQQIIDNSNPKVDGLNLVSAPDKIKTFADAITKGTVETKEVKEKMDSEEIVQKESDDKK